ncbi:MAG: hypothetical protein R3F55_22205 [Alphaproteobacteria bacterium]
MALMNSCAARLSALARRDHCRQRPGIVLCEPVGQRRPEGRVFGTGNRGRGQFRHDPGAVLAAGRMRAEGCGGHDEGRKGRLAHDVPLDGGGAQCRKRFGRDRARWWVDGGNAGIGGA